MKSNNKVEVIVPDKYLKSVVFNPFDDLFIGAIKCLKERGKTCEFLGFNIWNGHVVIIDGIKYYTYGNSTGCLDSLSYETFFDLDDEDYDYIENRFNKRVNQILDVLEDKR
jgi:hypothetical protein